MALGARRCPKPCPLARAMAFPFRVPRGGTLALQIPKVRTGSFFPNWLKPGRRAERALVTVVAEAYVHGV
jgi:hypothetical protein